MKGSRFAASILLVIAVALSGCLTARNLGPPAHDQHLGGSLAAPHVVIAHIDTGINPYHVAFRSPSAFAYLHPSTFIPGYPKDAKPLNLTLDAPDYETALKADEKAWSAVKAGKLYYVPGTRIIGAISFGDGGRLCPVVPVPPANQLDPLQSGCKEHKILDDFGHGTMTASRMAGSQHSLNPQGYIVSIEGDPIPAVDFIAKSGWIDVVSNSWGELLPSAAASSTQRAVSAAANHALFLFASGNGLGFLNGVVGQPTQIIPTGTPNVILVGAHDNGYLTTWHGFPTQVIADGYGGWRAARASMVEWGPSPEACCTSTSAPYASGGAAAILLQARSILGDSQSGLRGSGDAAIFAEGKAGLVSEGPLKDGRFTMWELKQVLEATADARPPVTGKDSDDGLVNWAARPGTLPQDPWPGDNPYCVACFTSPVPLSQIPRGVPLVENVGYGAITAQSVQLAKDVLSGREAMPQRPLEDQYFALDHQVRQIVNP